MSEQAYSPLKVAAIVLGVVASLSVLSRATAKHKGYSPEFINHCQRLVKQALHFHNVAKQDRLPLVALIHANQALSYARIAKSLTQQPKDITRISKVNINQLIRLLEDDQELRMQNIRKKCPTLKADNYIPTSEGHI
jgi:hypothetical protein